MADSKLTIFQKLYDSEINFLISTFWDGGFDVKIGDKTNGYDAETNVDTMEEAAEFLRVMAILHYPNSNFTIQENQSNGG
jgi:hypothetical protein